MSILLHIDIDFLDFWLNLVKPVNNRISWDQKAFCYSRCFCYWRVSVFLGHKHINRWRCTTGSQKKKKMSNLYHQTSLLVLIGFNFTKSNANRWLFWHAICVNRMFYVRLRDMNVLRSIIHFAWPATFLRNGSHCSLSWFGNSYECRRMNMAKGVYGTVTLYFSRDMFNFHKSILFNFTTVRLFFRVSLT